MASPEVKIISRGDSGCCWNALMSWCEKHNVDHLFGIERNERLRKIIGAEIKPSTIAVDEVGSGSGNAATAVLIEHDRRVRTCT